MKEATHCNDCGMEFKSHNSQTVKQVSARHGLIYEGKPICYRCSEFRYEDVVREKEYNATNKH